MSQHQRDRLPLPWWGLLYLVPGVILVTYASIMLGAEALASGSWTNGIGWGLFVAVGLGVVFWVSHLASPNWAFIIIAGFYFCVSVGSQSAFYDLARDQLHRRVHASEAGVYPAEWKSLSPEECYQKWMAKVLEDPHAHGWWDHLSAQVKSGITNKERASEYIEGQSSYRDVYRQGGWIYINWLAQYLFVALACVLSLAGCAVWDRSVRKQERLRKFAEEENESLRNALRERGLSEQAVRDVFHSSARRKILEQSIDRKHLVLLLPQVEKTVLNEIYQDLEFNRIWRLHHDAERALDAERRQLAEDIINRYYYGKMELIGPSASWIFILIAAQRLREMDDNKTMWQALREIYDTVLALGHADQIPGFMTCDMSDLKYDTVRPYDQWVSLCVHEAVFYRPESCWPQLEKMSIDAIPEAAYLGILYQYYFAPDRRVHEWWHGLEPQHLVSALGSRLRNALLTFVQREEQWFAENSSGSIDGLFALVGGWPFVDAAPIIECALQSGWRRSCTKIPETEEWKSLLSRYEQSPFGAVSSYVDWYEQYKRAMGH